MINNYFNKLICINLDKRTDRLHESQKQWAAHNLKVERIRNDEENCFFDKYFKRPNYK